MAKTERPRVLIDSSALLATIRDEPSAARLDGLLGFIDRGEAHLVESVLVLAEVYKTSQSATPAERDEQNARLDAIRARIESPGTLLLDVTPPVARKATDFRDQYHLKLPDAVHLATAVLNRCDWLVTLDRDFPSLGELRMFRMEDLFDQSITLPWDNVLQDELPAEPGNVVHLHPRVASG